MDTSLVMLDTVNLKDILVQASEDIQPKRRGRKKKVVEEPTEEEMLNIAETLEEELNAWSIYTCSACKQKADLLLSKFDGEGNVICPHCQNPN